MSGCFFLKHGVYQSITYCMVSGINFFKTGLDSRIAREALFAFESETSSAGLAGDVTSAC